jgi:tight adherence protein B
MTYNLITLSTFAATTLLVISVVSLLYDWLFRYRLVVRERLRELERDGEDEDELSLFKGLGSSSGSETISHRSLSERLEHMFEQAGVKCSVGVFAGWCLGLAVAPAAIAFHRGIYWSVGAVVVGLSLPWIVLYTRRQYRRRALCSQLPEAFEMMSRAVRAGQTVPAALKIIAEDFEPPIADEFSLCYEQQNLGISRESALRMLADRTGVMELQIFVVALLVQARYGGDLAELLQNLAGTIRKRFKLSDRVRALTGEGRMQALVLTILPIAALVALLVISPEYVQTLFDRPWILGVTLGVQAIGVIWIRRIVQIEA